MDREETIKVLDYHLYSVPKPLSDAIASAIALLKDQETELCDRCGRRRLKSSRVVKG